MSFEMFDRSNKGENRFIDKEEEADPKMTRRGFIKRGLALAGMAALSSSLIEILKEDSKEIRDRKEIQDTDDNLEFASQLAEPTDEQVEIEEENILSLKEVLDYDREEDIELTPEIMEGVKNHWKERYRNVPELKRSFESAYESMGEWRPYLEKEFQRRNVPERYLYLAIPESHWQLKAVSSKGAVGPYQFIPQTARSYGLKTDYFEDHPRNIEERSDPIKSAGACAELLSDLYRAGNDWNLALSGYNGGFFWRYLRNVRNNKGKDISYKGFLSYLEGKINGIRKELRSMEFYEHTIRSGESMGAISRRFNIDTDQLCKINSVDDVNRVYVGQKIKIPVSKESRRELFKSRIRGMEENLNYPSKFNAVYELIDEGEVERQKSPVTFRIRKMDSGLKRHVFKKEDVNLYRLSLKFDSVSVQDIVDHNPHIDPNSLRGGEEIVIPDRNASTTLESVSKLNNFDLKKMEALNPAIKESRGPIPKQYEIRV